MKTSHRRDFVKQGLAGTAAMTLVNNAHADGSSSTISLALIGCGGRGRVVAEVLARLDKVEVRACCDPRKERLASASRHLGIESKYAVSDLRKLLEDDTIDAVVIATPDHWHAPAAILACDAGKHVYVEKPCSHNVREGRQLVEAARRNDCVVQHGTQVRSTSMMIEAVQRLRDGIIGEVLAAKAWNVQHRANIGHTQPVEVPAGIDYETWVGPAELVPFRENLVDSAWHWAFNFGTGDMGNDGVHDIDYVRWGLGVETHPTHVTGAGGKYFFDDDQQFPDTQQVTFEYPSNGRPGQQKMLTYEQRLWSTNYPGGYNVDSGGEFYGTEGRMFLSRRGKIQVLDPRNQRVETGIQPKEQDLEAHARNFIDCVRTGQRPNGDIEIGHMTSSLCHLGNVATRLRRSLTLDPDREVIPNDHEANDLLGRQYREHWGTPRV